MSITRRDFLKASSVGLLSVAAFSRLAETEAVAAHPRTQDLWPVPPRVLVMGIGDAGGAVVREMMNRRLPGVEHIWVHTDARALEYYDVDVKVLIRPRTTRGLDAGNRAEYGRQAMEESRDRVQEILAGADLVLLAGGMGGGTVTGATPVIAQLAREAGALAVAVVTKPFQFEGRWRHQQARDGILELSRSADTTILVPGDKIMSVLANGKATLREMFQRLDARMVKVLRTIIRMIIDGGLINVGSADIRAVMGNRSLGAADRRGPWPYRGPGWCHSMSPHRCRR